MYTTHHSTIFLIINPWSPFVKPLVSIHVLSSIVTTVLSCPMPVWTMGRAAGSPFQIKAQIRYPMEVIRYPLKKMFLSFNIQQ